MNDHRKNFAKSAADCFDTFLSESSQSHLFPTNARLKPNRYIFPFNYHLWKFYHLIHATKIKHSDTSHFA